MNKQKLFVANYGNSREAWHGRWPHVRPRPHAYFEESWTATKIGTVEKIGATLHSLAEHAPAAVRAKWRRANNRLTKIHYQPFNLVMRDILKERF